MKTLLFIWLLVLCAMIGVWLYIGKAMHDTVLEDQAKQSQELWVETYSPQDTFNPQETVDREEL